MSIMVTKYIDEMEKNLRCLFHSAECGGAILLFDQADDLFGRRSPTKATPDCYTNQDVAFLL